MPAHLAFDDYFERLHATVAAFRDLCERAEPGSPVPTCPNWDVLDLIAHQGRVHRWATAQLLGLPDRWKRDPDEGRTVPDPLAWFDEGALALLETLRSVPDHVDGRVPPFLADAEPPRPFWARRQAHEIAIHAVDALAAALGRSPTSTEVTAEVPISTGFAADGVDELLCGFLPIGRSRLRAVEPYTALVETNDTGHAWTVRVGPDRPATTVGRDGEQDAIFTGTAVGLYLGLWNRGDELIVTGRDGMVDEWRSLAVV